MIDSIKQTAKKYLSVWVRLAQMAFLVQCSTRLASLGWLGGKCVRLFFFLIFLTAIFKHIPTVAGYSLLEIAFFFLTYNVVDIIAQLFFRGIYMIGRDIREGDMDFYLIQPVNTLFRISSNLVDFLDFLTLLPVLALIVFLLPKVVAGASALTSFFHILLYLALCFNGVLIAFSLHVFVASLTVRTQQMENTIWLYRDMMSLGRFPVEIYAKPIQYILTLILPVAVMVSYPSKMLLNLLSAEKIIFAFSLAAILLVISLSVWRGALKHYCSISS